MSTFAFDRFVFQRLVQVYGYKQ